MGPLTHFNPKYHIPQLGHLYNNNNIHIIMNNYIGFAMHSLVDLLDALGTQYGLYLLMNRSHVVSSRYE